jgi:hypothetical protein
MGNEPTHLRLRVDFSYGGIVGHVGHVYLGRKRGDRTLMRDDIVDQANEQHVELTEGGTVLLIDAAGELGSTVGVLKRSDEYGWYAEYAVKDCY